MSKKKPRVTSSVKLVFMSGTITADGIQHDLPPVNYRRVETSDGKVEETGLPEGCRPGATVGEIFSAAMSGGRKRIEAKVTTKGTKPTKRK
jgi:hypothetical protein